MLAHKELNARIASVSKRAATLRADIQIILVNAAGHAYQYRDVTAFTRLFAATSGVNRKAIAEWVRDYGFATLQKDGTFKLNSKARDEAHFADGAACVEYLTENAREWFATEADAKEITKQLDVAARLKALVNQITNAANKNTELAINPQEIEAALRELNNAIAKAA